MPSLALYFQVHQPYRIRRVSYFDRGSTDKDSFDDTLNRSIMEGVAKRCYLPTNKVLLDLIGRHEGRFKVTFSLTGTVVEQMRRYAPEALASFRALADTGAVEFLGESYHHSLAMMYAPDEYREQVALHRDLIRREFGREPTVFRHTELLYSDELGDMAYDMGFRGVLAEGVDRVLGWRSPNVTYTAASCPLRVITRNHQLSDALSFRFRELGGETNGAVAARKYAEWVHSLSHSADVVGVFMDYETFGEHYRSDSGIFETLKALPSAILCREEWDFITPSEVLARYPSSGVLTVPNVTSWADTERDDSAWRGDEMQRAALRAVYDLGKFLRQIKPDPADLLDEWRRLQTSDHFYYMSTKGAGDGAVHNTFSPFDSPYDAFIAYMNVLRSFARRVSEVTRPEVDYPLDLRFLPSSR